MYVLEVETDIRDYQMDCINKISTTKTNKKEQKTPMNNEQKTQKNNTKNNTRSNRIV